MQTTMTWGAPWRRAMFAAACALWFCAAQAATPQEREAEVQAATEAANKARVAGPADIKLRDQAVLKLPAGMTYIPQPAAGQLMKAYGNGDDDELVGLVEPADGDWLVVAEYRASGYIKDDDAKDWNVDELFKSLKEGTDAGNEERRQRGIPELEVTGWVEKPHYEPATHRLVWAMAARTKGEPDNDASSVNYNTYALGREGYLSLNLITSRGAVERDKPVAHTLLSSLDFNQGKRYADFDSKTDHVAEYGLAALVAGVAAKKLGLIAVIAAFAAKFAKVIGLAVVGLGAAATKLFKGRGEKA
jgi:uncharacterized membrane-anchored protein